MKQRSPALGRTTKIKLKAARLLWLLAHDIPSLAGNALIAWIDSSDGEELCNTYDQPVTKAMGDGYIMAMLLSGGAEC